MPATILIDDRKIEDLKRRGYKTEEVKAVERWAAYCSGVISVVPEHVEPLKRSLRSLAGFAQREWHAMQGYPDYIPTLWTGQLDGFPLGEESAETFVMLTGDVLLAGADSPNLTARWMEEALDKIGALDRG